MFYNTKNEKMIQQKVRKKKRRVLKLIFITVTKNCGTKITYISQYYVCEHEEVLNF